MWICLNDAFFSIVSKDCARDEVLVRARRKGDIEKVFPNADVKMIDVSDYLFRARIKRSDVAAALANEVSRIGYGNFKDSVEDAALHRAYSRVWTVMAELQPSMPWQFYRDKPISFVSDFDQKNPTNEQIELIDALAAKRSPKKKKRVRKRRRSLRRGSRS